MHKNPLGNFRNIAHTFRLFTSMFFAVSLAAFDSTEDDAWIYDCFLIPAYTTDPAEDLLWTFHGSVEKNDEDEDFSGMDVDDLFATCLRLKKKQALLEQLEEQITSEKFENLDLRMKSLAKVFGWGTSTLSHKWRAYQSKKTLPWPYGILKRTESAMEACQIFNQNSVYEALIPVRKKCLCEIHAFIKTL